MAKNIKSTMLASVVGQKYISLTTFRKTGAAVVTPVWFTELAGTLYIYTDATAGKVKRIRNNPQVQFAACTLRGVVTGPTIPGSARIVTDREEIASAETAINKKYRVERRLLRLAYQIMDLFRRKQPEAGIVYLAITD